MRLNVVLAILLVPLVAMGKDIQIFSPVYGYARLEDQTVSRVTLEIPLKPVVDQIIAKLNAERLNVIQVEFARLPVGEPLFRLDVRVGKDARVGGWNIDVDCSLRTVFALPAARIDKVKMKVLDAYAECESGNVVVGMLGVLNDIASGAIKDMQGALAGGAGAGSEDLESFIKGDPKLGAVVTGLYVQGQYCEPRQQPSICLVASHERPDAFRSYVADLERQALTGKKGFDRTKVRTHRAGALKRACELNMKQSTTLPGFSYPAERVSAGDFADGDMALFGGLLCVAGLHEGCELVAHSQDASGQFWRAPDKIGTLRKDESPFSGDQFWGVVGYLARTKDVASFDRFLSAVTKNKVPMGAPTFVDAYKTCSQDNNKQCVLGGPEWFAIGRLADVFGRRHLVPSDVADARMAFGYDESVRVWEAAFTPVGYRLHLIGVQNLLLQFAGDKSESTRRVAKILSARQPQNPFFLWLNLGADQRVFDMTKSFCEVKSNGLPLDQWAWQREDAERAWEHSMNWDCGFIYSLLYQAFRAPTAACSSKSMSGPKSAATGTAHGSKWIGSASTMK